jgi:hypothetical protein
LYFPPSEVGKSVLVRFEYRDPVNTSQYYTRSMVLTIGDELSDTSAPAGFGTQGRMAAARLADPTALSGDYDVQAILSVQGLSVQSRTAWVENNARYVQAEAVGYRKLGGS